MNKENAAVLERLKQGNELYIKNNQNAGDVSLELRKKTAKEGQHPYAIVITCSDSRVIPDAIFSAGIGDLFVIRVAGNVLDNHQLGSIEYAFSHLETNVIVMLGHTKCGAIEASQRSIAHAIERPNEVRMRSAKQSQDCEAGLHISERDMAHIHKHAGDDKFIKYILEDISEAIGDETDDYKATVLNVKHGVNVIKNAFHDHPDIEDGELDVLGAVYDIETGVVEWI